MPTAICYTMLYTQSTITSQIAVSNMIYVSHHIEIRVISHHTQHADIVQVYKVSVFPPAFTCVVSFPKWLQVLYPLQSLTTHTWLSNCLLTNPAAFLHLPHPDRLIAAWEVLSGCQRFNERLNCCSLGVKMNFKLVFLPWLYSILLVSIQGNNMCAAVSGKINIILRVRPKHHS